MLLLTELGMCSTGCLEWRLFSELRDKTGICWPSGISFSVLRDKTGISSHRVLATLGYLVERHGCDANHQVSTWVRRLPSRKQENDRILSHAERSTLILGIVGNVPRLTEQWTLSQGGLLLVSQSRA
jgi:hypothetical protein